MEIKKVEYKDAIDIKKLLVSSPSIVDTGKLLPEVLQHVDKDDCVANKIDRNGDILGVWLSKEFDTYTSLSYLFVAEELRTSFIVLKFIGECIKEVNPNKPIIIKTSCTTGFDRYVENIGDGLYVFKGFR